MNLRHVSLISSDSVAVNIITYLLWGVFLKICWMSLRMSVIKDQENLVKDGRGGMEGKLTDVVEDLVTLVENEHLEVVQIE